jgi:hypothetical protein
LNNEEIKKELDGSGLSLVAVLGKAKRTWGDSKKVIEYTDKLSRDEQKIFAEDTYLAGLVLEKIRIDSEIVEHIDKTVQNYRLQMIKNDIEEKKEAEEMAIKNEDKGWKSPKELGLVE